LTGFAHRGAGMGTKIIQYKEAKTKGLKRYFTGIPCCRGHMVERLTSTRGCIMCNRIHEKKYSSSKHGKLMRLLKARRYRKNNLEKIQKRERARSKTPEFKKRVSEYNKKRNQLPHVKADMRIRNKAYRKKHLKRLLQKDRDYRKNVRMKNPIYIIKELCRRRILLALDNKGGQKSESLIKLLGCSIEKYIVYLEKQFYNHPKTNKKMTWKNRGLKGWHIDHIIPLHSFNLTKQSQQLKAFNYKNTQPMWAEYNLQKASKII
jgi:hypothetical protein